MQQGLNLEGKNARMALACGYSGELLRFLRHRVGSPDDASDLHQETFVRLAGGDATPIRDFRAYVFRVARNLSADFLRAERRRRDRFVAEIPENLAADQVSPERALLDKAELNHLLGALSTLPERQRVALLLYRLEGLSLKEIGVRLGVSESMACRYVAAALGHCAGVLER